jgi:predicted amidohydrolase YtcJ
MTNGVSRRTFLTGAAATGIGAAAGLASPTAALASGTGPAATVIHNARVFVGDRANTVTSAVAVGRDGRVLALGDYGRLRRLVGRSTQLVDAGGGTVISGIQDGHVHPMYAGLRAMNPSLDDAEITVPDLQAALTGFLDASADKEPDGWLVVESWNPVGLLPTGTVADKAYLDVLPTRRPIILRGSDGHNSWVNSRALEIAKVDRTTPDPDGGSIVRDGAGNPTGLLKDSAQDLVAQYIPEPTWEEMVTAFAGAFAQMAAGGITTCLDAWVDPWQLDGYAELAGRGLLPQRVVPALLAGHDQIRAPKETLAWAKDLAATYGAVPGLRFGTMKVFMDGVIEYPAQTAALLEPYLDADGNPTDHYGDLYVDGTTMGSFAQVFDRAGWQVHAHAIGDAAVRAALDGYEAARRANGRRGNRHTIAHLQLVHPDDYGRFAQLDVVPDMQLQWATRNVWTEEALEPFIGPERHARMYPARSMVNAGARIAGGSDWPVDPLHPWNQVQTAIDRLGLYGEGSPLYAEEGLTRTQSLRMHTLGTAYQLHQERTTGSLQVGKQADLVVLDRDITCGPVSEIKDATPQLTMVGGRTVFDASSSAGRAVQRTTAASAAAAKVVGAGRLSHGALAGSRHAGCPCTAGQRH